MSATFILEYAGRPVNFAPSHAPALVTESEATHFADESSAWLEAYCAALTPKHCRVVNLHERQQQPPVRQS